MEAYNIWTSTRSLTMQTPIAVSALPELLLVNGRQSSVAQPGWLLSLGSQMKLKSLHEYIDSSREILSELDSLIWADKASPNLKKAAERLECFCFEADSWGFNDIFDVAQGLRRLLLNSIGRSHTEGFQEAATRGLAMLSALLTQCERDFCWRMATADTLDFITQADDIVS
jgi:hypothetical protein